MWRSFRYPTARPWRLASRSAASAKRWVRVRDSLAAWQLRVPQLRTTWDALGHSFGQSVNDLASLRMQSDGGGIGKLPAQACHGS